MLLSSLVYSLSVSLPASYLPGFSCSLFALASLELRLSGLDNFSCSDAFRTFNNTIPFSPCALIIAWACRFPDFDLPASQRVLGSSHTPETNHGRLPSSSLSRFLLLSFSTLVLPLSRPDFPGHFLFASLQPVVFANVFASCIRLSRCDIRPYPTTYVRL